MSTFLQLLLTFSNNFCPQPFIPSQFTAFFVGRAMVANELKIIPTSPFKFELSKFLQRKVVNSETY